MLCLVIERLPLTTDPSPTQAERGEKNLRVICEKTNQPPQQIGCDFPRWDIFADLNAGLGLTLKTLGNYAFGGDARACLDFG